MKEASLRIDKEGRWFFRGEEITHRKTYLLYCRSLTLDESGRVILQIGREQCPVEVEDVPFVVRTLDFVLTEGEDLKSVWLILNDETREELHPETLRIGPDHVPYCRVRAGKFEARFSRGAYQLLTPYIRHDEKENRFFITIGGRPYDLSHRRPL
jgi:uncharacterized protein